MSLQRLIEGLAAAGGKADKDVARAAFAQLRAELSSGTVRAAEPDASSPAGWRVNTWTVNEPAGSKPMTVARSARWGLPALR